MAPLDYILSRDAQWAHAFSLLLAHGEKAERVEVRHQLAGIYIASLEKVERYWDNWLNFEKLVSHHCGVVEPRWSYWMTWREQISSAKHLSLGGVTIAPLTSSSLVGHRFKFSATLSAAYRTARELTRITSHRHGTNLPVITTETLLLAISEDEHETLSKELSRSGLNVGLLKATVASADPTVDLLFDDSQA